MTKKLTLGAFFIALAIIVPQIFHLSGIPQSGNVFLPMHLPVLLCGFVLGPVWGLAIGAASPVISSFLTGMPPMARLPFMIFELAAYGGLTGLLFQTLGLGSKRFGSVLTLAGAMAGGRIIYALCLLAAASLFGMNITGPAAAITASVTGIPGIVLQFIFIPPIVYALKKGGFIYDTTAAGSRSTPK